MFYTLSKVAWFLATPSNFLPLLALAGAVLAATGLARALGLSLAILAPAPMLAAGLSPLANWLALPLEERFPAYRDDGTPVTGIIVLGGAVNGDDSTARGVCWRSSNSPAATRRRGSSFPAEAVPSSSGNLRNPKPSPASARRSASPRTGSSSRRARARPRRTPRKRGRWCPRSRANAGSS